MSYINNQKRAQRIRRKLKMVNTERYRLTVFRSSKNISAQIIDDVNNKTLVSASSINEKNSKKKKRSCNWTRLCFLSMFFYSIIRRNYLQFFSNNFGSSSYNFFGRNF